MDDDWYRRAELRWRSQLRPERALGRLEGFVFKLAAIRRKMEPELQNAVCLIFAGDHGVSERGVSAMPGWATGALLESASRGGTAANIFGESLGVDVRMIDVGSRLQGDSPSGIVDRRVRAGTRDIVVEPALTPLEVATALAHGRSEVRIAIEGGAEAVGIGEIGIGNTTVAAALAARLLNLPEAETVGTGTGVHGEALWRKREAVRLALLRVDRRDLNSTELIAELGGLEVAALMGAVLECAEAGIPLVLDGYLTCVSALLAARAGAPVREVAFAAHLTREQGHSRILGELGLEPLIELEFNLGEGTGALVGLALLVLGSRLLARLSCFDTEVG